MRAMTVEHARRGRSATQTAPGAGRRRDLHDQVRGQPGHRRPGRHARAAATEQEHAGHYLHITTTVTSKIVGKTIKPVKIDSLVPPTRRLEQQAHGTLGVKVVDRNGVGVTGVAVSPDVSPAFAPTSSATDATGCAVFQDIPIGTYTIRLERRATSTPRATRSRRSRARRSAQKVVTSRRSPTTSRRVDVDVDGHTPTSAGAATPRSARGRRESRPSTPSASSLLRTSRHASRRPGHGDQPVPVQGLLRVLHRQLRRTQRPRRRVAASPNYFNTNNAPRSRPRRPDAWPAAASGRPSASRRSTSASLATRTRRSRCYAQACASLLPARPTPARSRRHDDGAEGLAEPGRDVGHPAQRDRPVGRPQTATTFDPGMPFGTYDICVRDTAPNPTSIQTFVLQQHGRRTGRPPR